MATLIRNQFLLSSPTAERLYYDYAQNCPIIDYHCHIEAKDIAENISYKNLTELWLSGDHYKWRLMRSAGIDEKYITGDADDYEKFYAWVKVIEGAVGNPLYHWTALELLRYFDMKEPLTTDNAEQVWNTTSAMLTSGNMRARDLITRSNVERLCTTDDPIDDLSYHQMISDDLSFTPIVLPAFRPDRALDIQKKDFPEYIQKLSEVSGIQISGFEDLLSALSSRLDLFSERGCKLSDHGMENFVFIPAADEDADRILRLRLMDSQEDLSFEEEAIYRSALLVALSKEYAKRGWAMQIHFGCRRDNNSEALRNLGINTGFDTIAGGNFVAPLANYMSYLTEMHALPRMILYSLNPNDDALIDTLIGCFQDGTIPMKVQHGAAWWFNDHQEGIRRHLKSLASQSYLPGFLGMLTDSRCLLSYTRHEYFRRILCDYLGSLVENGEYPKDMERLGAITQNICYYNARNLFFPS